MARVVLLALPLAACAGSVEELEQDPGPAGTPGKAGASSGGTPGTPGSMSMPGSPGAPAAPGAMTTPGTPGSTKPPLDAPGPMPLRRLTRDELNATLRDLLGDTTSPAKALPVDSRGVHGFLEAGAVSTVDAESLLDMVDRIGTTVKPRLAQLVACDPAAMGEDACLGRFVRSFGRRAFRRPVTDAEVTRFVDYGKQVKAQLAYPFLEVARVVLEGMLLSPGFLYHWELGPQTPVAQGGLVKLNPHELGSRLSYFLWGTMPDDTLFAAADGGRLQSDVDLEREARRMLMSPKARPIIASFHSQFLHLEKLPEMQKDTKAHPEWSAEVATAMVNETAEFTTRTILDGPGTLEALLTSTKTYLNLPLARLYRVTGPTTRDFVAADLDPSQRAGLFTLAAFLSVHATATASHPVKRGHKLFQDVLCGQITSPPDMVPPAGVPPPNVSTREQFAIHSANACAKACHALIDPPGFAFEHYDAIGRHRTMDGGKPVDATGMLRDSTTGQMMPFNNAIELVKRLPGMPDVQRCFSEQWFRFALARHEVDGDAASLAVVLDGLRKSGGNLRELLVGVTRARAFGTRAVAPGEVTR